MESVRSNLFFLFGFFFVLFLCFVGGALDVVGRVLAEDVLQGGLGFRGVRGSVEVSVRVQKCAHTLSWFWPWRFSDCTKRSLEQLPRQWRRSDDVKFLPCPFNHE